MNLKHDQQILDTLTESNQDAMTTLKNFSGGARPSAESSSPVLLGEVVLAFDVGP